MTVAFDAVTRFPAPNSAQTGDSTAGDRTFTHTPVGTPAGALVVVGNNATTSAITGVLYGGTAMTPVISAVDTSEAGFVQIFFLGTSVPAGAQTVTLQGNSGFLWAACYTVTAGTAATEIDVSAKTDTTTSGNPSRALTLTTAGLSFGICHSGSSAPGNLLAGTGCTKDAVDGMDYGSSSGASVRRSSEDAAGSVTLAFSFATSEDWCFAAAAVKESAGGGGGPTFVPQIVIL